MSVYRIERYSAGRLMTSETRKQFPAARRMLEAVTYDMLEANGLLDRPVAHKRLATASRITRDVEYAAIALDQYAVVAIQRIG